MTTKTKTPPPVAVPYTSPVCKYKNLWWNKAGGIVLGDTMYDDLSSARSCNHESGWKRLAVLKITITTEVA